MMLCIPYELWANITTVCLTQPEDIGADLVEDGGTSWTKSKLVS